MDRISKGNKKKPTSSETQLQFVVFLHDFCCSPMAKDFLLCEVLVLAKKNRVVIALQLLGALIVLRHL